MFVFILTLGVIDSLEALEAAVDAALPMHDPATVSAASSKVSQFGCHTTVACSTVFRSMTPDIHIEVCTLRPAEEMFALTLTDDAGRYARNRRSTSPQGRAASNKLPAEERGKLLDGKPQLCLAAADGTVCFLPKKQAR